MTSRPLELAVLLAGLVLLATTEYLVAANALPRCDPGSFLSKDTGLCVACVAGTDFTDEHNRHDACTPCATCTGGRRVTSDCTITRNTICGCRDGEYEHADGCTPIQGTEGSDVSAQLRIHYYEINKLSLTAQSYYDRFSAQLQAQSDVIKNLSMAVTYHNYDISAQLLTHNYAIKNLSLTAKPYDDRLSACLQIHSDAIKNLSLNINSNFDRLTAQLQRQSHFLKNLSLTATSGYDLSLGYGHTLQIAFSKEIQNLQNQFLRQSARTDDVDENQKSLKTLLIVFFVCVMLPILITTCLTIYLCHHQRHQLKLRSENCCGENNSRPGSRCLEKQHKTPAELASAAAPKTAKSTSVGSRSSSVLGEIIPEAASRTASAADGSKVTADESAATASSTDSVAGPTKKPEVGSTAVSPEPTVATLKSKIEEAAPQCGRRNNDLASAEQKEDARQRVWQATASTGSVAEDGAGAVAESIEMEDMPQHKLQGPAQHPPGNPTIVSESDSESEQPEPSSTTPLLKKKNTPTSYDCKQDGSRLTQWS